MLSLNLWNYDSEFNRIIEKYLNKLGWVGPHLITIIHAFHFGSGWSSPSGNIYLALRRKQLKHKWQMTPDINSRCDLLPPMIDTGSCSGHSCTLHIEVSNHSTSFLISYLSNNFCVIIEGITASSIAIELYIALVMKNTIRVRKPNIGRKNMK